MIKPVETPMDELPTLAPDAEPYAVPADVIGDICRAIQAQDPDMAAAIIDELHVADKAELLNALNEEQRYELTGMLCEAFDHDILPELTPEAAGHVLDALGVDRSAEALSYLDTDDAVHVIEELDAQDQRDILDAIPEARRNELEEGLSYPEESAGRLMTKKLICVPEFWSVGDTIDYLRSHPDLPDHFYIVYVVDPKFRPLGRLLLGKVMQHKREKPVREIMDTEVYPVKPDTDQEHVAYLFSKYALVEAPVVNDEGRLVGTITVDDIMDVIHEEEEEDYLRAGGVKSQDIQANVRDTVRQRFPWLFINLLTAVAASLVIGLYSDTIEQLVALAVLMPIVASMGGNAGTQSVTVAVRALATRQLQSSNSFKVIRKELLIGLLNGVGLAAIMAAGTYAWYQDIRLAVVFAIATIVTLMVAGLSGAAIPIVLNRLKVDPAVSSGIFLTTVTDVVGFLTFLGLAAAILL